MTTLIGDLQSIMGTPFGGEGHAVLIFSRVSRAAFQSNAVIIELHDRIPMPKEAGGQFVVEGLDPGPIRVELEGGTVHGHGWNLDLPEEGEWSLADLLDAQVEWSPAVVGRAEEAASKAARQAVAAEGHAGVAAEHREHMDTVVYDVMTNAAGMVRDEVKDDADRAQTQAGVAAEQAGLAQGHREGAEDAEDSAHAAAGAAAEATKAEIRSEMDSKVSEAEQAAQAAGAAAEATKAEIRDEMDGKVAEAEGHAQEAGLSAAASATSEGESATSAQEAGQSAQAAGQHLQDTRDLKNGIDAWWLDDLLPKVNQVADDRAATQDDRRQTGEDRTATGGHLTEVERLHGETEQARDDAQEAAANAQLGAPPEGWQREDMHVDVREDLSRARSALQDVPDATGEARGVIRLAGDLEGTAQAPRVRGLADKLDQDDAAEAGASPISTPSKIIRHSAAGELVANERPQSSRDAASHLWVTEQIGTRAPSEHRHPADQIDGLDALIDQRAGVLVREAPKMHVWDGEGTWVAPAGAGPNDSVLNTDTGEIHSVEDING